MTRDPTHLAYWLRLFETFPERIHRVLVRDGLAGERFEERWAAFVPEYAEAMRERRENLTAYEQSTIAYAGMRQALLNRYGWPDPYLRVKARENATAIGLYPQVIAEIDAAVPAERWGLLLRGIFAGNMFDLGSPRTIEMFDRGGFGWHVMLEHVPERPWHIDHADALCERLTGRAYRQALFFVDNAGTDIVLGTIPAIREMARSGIRVVIAANSTAALNDITYAELGPLLDELSAIDPVLRGLRADGQIDTVPSGGGSPLIDLSRVSEACNRVAAESDLVVLEGMGRGVESNWQAEFDCDVWRVALVKDEVVAAWIGGRVFDAVCRFDPARR